MPLTVYSVTEAAEMSGVHRRVITKRCAEERIGCQHVSSGEWFLTEAEIKSLTAEKRGRGRPNRADPVVLDSLIRAGQPHKDIADRLGLAVSTVRNRASMLNRRATASTPTD